MKKYATILAALLVFGFGGNCLFAQQAQKPVLNANAAAERIPNLDKLKAELRQYHECKCTCGCYARDMDAQAERAITFLRQRAAHPKPNEKLALILDIDETTLSNYEEEAGADFGYDPAVFDAWVQKAVAPAIPGTLKLYKEAQRLGVNIFFITGRLEKERAATEQNLRAQGFDNWQQLTMRPDVNGAQTTGQFKAAVRGQIVAAGYTLALNVGDQWSDLKGKPEAEYSVKYPDPFYFVP